MIILNKFSYSMLSTSSGVLGFWGFGVLGFGFFLDLDFSHSSLAFNYLSKLNRTPWKTFSFPSQILISYFFLFRFFLSNQNSDVLTLIQSGIVSEGISSNQISQHDNLCSARQQCETKY